VDKAQLMVRLIDQTEEWKTKSSKAAAARLNMRTATDASKRADKAEWMAWQAVLAARRAVEGATDAE
jgi:hypothetical protein